jgi:hypothetical protein
MWTILFYVSIVLGSMILGAALLYVVGMIWLINQIKK